MRAYLLAGLLLAFSCWVSRSADNQSPSAIAERQEAEERYKRLTAEVEDLKTTIQSFQQRFNAMRDELSKINDELERLKSSGKDSAMQESLKSLAKAIEEVDKRRQADHEKVLAELSRLMKTLSGKAPASGPKATPRGTRNSEPGAKVEKGYEYSIKEGDTLSAIVARLANQGMKVTQKQISEANPGVNWSRLQIGQKIFIPAQ